MLAATGIAVGCVVWHWLADQPVIHAKLALASIELIAGRSADTAAGGNAPGDAVYRQMSVGSAGLRAPRASHGTSWGQRF
jgi:hypothetical protein